jgi:hypothetical protein
MKRIDNADEPRSLFASTSGTHLVLTYVHGDIAHEEHHEASSSMIVN